MRVTREPLARAAAMGDRRMNLLTKWLTTLCGAQFR